MKKIILVEIVIIVILQFAGVLFTHSEIVGWDYCIEAGHPFVAYSYNLGFPFRFMEIKLIYGCLSMPQIERNIDHNAPISNIVFWASVIWIISKVPERTMRRSKNEKIQCQNNG